MKESFLGLKKKNFPEYKQAVLHENTLKIGPNGHGKGAKRPHKL